MHTKNLPPGIKSEMGVSQGDGSEVQVSRIDLSKEDDGDSPLPGQVPPPYEEAETTFRKSSPHQIEEDRIQLQEETSLNYVYGKSLTMSGLPCCVR